MKKTILFTLLCLMLGLGTAWADSIDWCQFGCVGAGETSPQPWVSNDGATGTIGLVNGGFQGFYSFRQGTQLGTTWVGNFPSGMGVIYNGLAFGCALPGVGCQQAGIRITFDSPVAEVGAYIQGTEHGRFSATMTLFGQNGNRLVEVTVRAVSNQLEGTAPFIEAAGVGPIFAVQFDAISAPNPEIPQCSAGCEDFAIGTVEFGSLSSPEPSSLLLFGSGAFGLAGVIRRKLTRQGAFRSLKAALRGGWYPA